MRSNGENGTITEQAIDPITMAWSTDREVDRWVGTLEDAEEGKV